MPKTLYTLLALLTVLFVSGCAVSPAYPYYGLPTGGVYVTTPAPYYYTPAPYYAPWHGGYGYRRWH